MKYFIISRLLRLSFKNMKRKGVSLIECMILIIIAAFMLAAVLQTSWATSKLQQGGTQYVNSHKAAVSFFDKLEAVDINEDVSRINKDKFLDYIREFAPVDTRYIRSQDVSYDLDTGVMNVSITVIESETSDKLMERSFNIISNERVSDDRQKRN